jgi:hypothetical protein
MHYKFTDSYVKSDRKPTDRSRSRTTWRRMRFGDLLTNGTNEKSFMVTECWKVRRARNFFRLVNIVIRSRQSMRNDACSQSKKHMKSVSLIFSLQLQMRSPWQLLLEGRGWSEGMRRQLVADSPPCTIITNGSSSEAFPLPKPCVFIE